MLVFLSCQHRMQIEFLKALVGGSKGRDVTFKCFLKATDAGFPHSPFFVFYQGTSGMQKVSENKLCGLIL